MWRYVLFARIDFVMSSLLLELSIVDIPLRYRSVSGTTLWTRPKSILGIKVMYGPSCRAAANSIVVTATTTRTVDGKATILSIIVVFREAIHKRHMGGHSSRLTKALTIQAHDKGGFISQKFLLFSYLFLLFRKLLLGVSADENKKDSNIGQFLWEKYTEMKSSLCTSSSKFEGALRACSYI